MSRVLFVMGIAGGLGVAYLQHRSAQRNSNGAYRNVLNSSLMRAATTSPPNGRLHNVHLANRPDAISNENSITVPGILEKSWSADAVELWPPQTRSEITPT
jgi:hypothetical protein